MGLLLAVRRNNTPLNSTGSLSLARCTHSPEACGEVSDWFASKIKELANVPREGPLGEARTELTKLRAKAPASQERWC